MSVRDRRLQIASLAMQRRRIKKAMNLSSVFAGQTVGVKKSSRKSRWWLYEF